MTEQEEREQVKVKIIEDIDFLKSKEIDIRASLRSYFADIQTFSPVDIAFNTVKMNSYDYLDTGSIDDLRKYYTNFLNRFTIASRAFLNNSSNKNTQNELIESAKVFNDYMTTISTVTKTSSPFTQELAKSLSNNYDKSLSELIEENQKEQNYSSVEKLLGRSAQNIQLNDLEKRIENLEKKPDEIIKALNENLKQSEKLASNANELSLKSEQTLEDILKFKQETIEQNDKLVSKLENTINQKISVLLSDQLEKKSFRLWIETMIKFVFFIVATFILFRFNVGLLEIYFNTTQNLVSMQNELNTSMLPILSNMYPSLSKLDFWHFMMLKLTLNIPLLILIGFTLNEYTKSKKLYEEYEFRKILAITLFNNYERLTKELGLEKEDLHESLKSSLEKIFDNPVHSIYGDKSGDKNIGLDQLEKLSSILEKLKPKTS